MMQIFLHFIQPKGKIFYISDHTNSVEEWKTDPPYQRKNCVILSGLLGSNASIIGFIKKEKKEPNTGYFVPARCW